MAAGLSFIAPLLFVYIAEIFNTTPQAGHGCRITDYLDKPISEYELCWKNSNSYEAKVRRLNQSIPWFWVFFLGISFPLLKNPIKGRIRDDSQDIVYVGDIALEFLLHVLFQIGLIILTWAFIARDRTSFIALALIVAALVFCFWLDGFCRKKFGKPKLINKQ